MRNANSSGALQAVCPNFRGSGTLISNWRYIDHRLITQYIDDDDNQAENLLTPQNGSYDTDTQPSLLRGPRSNVQEEVGPDFRPTTSFSALTLTTDDVAAAISHDPTRLVDGRLSMIIDPGSVSNLCGSRWARDMAINAWSQRAVDRHTN